MDACQVRTTITVDYDTERRVERMSAVEFYEESGTGQRLTTITR